MRPLLLSILVWALGAATDVPAQAAMPAAADSSRTQVRPDFYRAFGFSLGIFYAQLSGVGNRLEYIEETDSYDATRLDGKSVFGFSLGMHVWSQRTQLHLDVGWTKGEYLEEGGFRNTTNGGNVDTYIDIGYFVGGLRLEQALVTRKFLATGGVYLVEEGRTRHAKTRSNGRLVESSSFPTDEFYLWSLGLEYQLGPGFYLGYSYSWTFNQDDFDPLYGRIDDPPIEVEGFTMNAIRLMFVY